MGFFYANKENLPIGKFYKGADFIKIITQASVSKASLKNLSLVSKRPRRMTSTIKFLYFFKVGQRTDLIDQSPLF